MFGFVFFIPNASYVLMYVGLPDEMKKQSLNAFPRSTTGTSHKVESLKVISCTPLVRPWRMAPTKVIR